ncbi:MAG: hypothetical protein ABIP49_02365 [Lysobacterales bacterium]
MTTQRRVLIAGASGLVGRAALDALLKDPAVTEIRILSRRTLDDLPHDPRVRPCITEFTHLDAHADWFQVEQVLCALGTTMRLAGSQAAFRRVDYEYPLAIGRLARAAGASHYALVSAAGANAHSSVFYNLVKGELELGLKALAWPSLTIARPSLLLGDRAEFRLGEIVAKRFGWLTPSAWKPVEAARVAHALVRGLRENAPGVVVLENRALRREP